jgi:hypothetical protein
MRTLARCAAVSLVVSIVLAWGAGLAPAAVQVDKTRIRATSAALTFNAAEVSVVCAVTLSMTLSASRIEPGAVAGNVTEARANEAGCTNGRFRFLTGGLPWPVRLVSVREGQLRLRVERLAGLADAAGGLARCLFQGNLEATNDEDPITRLSVDESVRMPLSATLGFFCPSEASVRGELVVSEEVGYAATEIGLPLQPTPAVVNFRRSRITLPIEFRNEWIVKARVNVRPLIPEAGRFVVVTEANECFRATAIRSGGRCAGRIELRFARDPGEPANVWYFLRYGPFEMGLATLSE